VNVGFARGASKARAEVKPVTCACVTVPEYDPAVVAVAALPLILIAYVAFGSTTVPVNVGEFFGAKSASAAVALDVSVPTAVEIAALRFVTSVLIAVTIDAVAKF
jgi:hypothetical protein